MLVPVVSFVVFSGAVLWWNSICSLLLCNAPSDIELKRLNLLKSLYDHVHVQHQTASGLTTLNIPKLTPVTFLNF